MAGTGTPQHPPGTTTSAGAQAVVRQHINFIQPPPLDMILASAQQSFDQALAVSDEEAAAAHRAAVKATLHLVRGGKP